MSAALKLNLETERLSEKPRLGKKVAKLRLVWENPKLSAGTQKGKPEVKPDASYGRVHLHWCRRSDGTYGRNEKEPRWIYKRQLRSSADNLNNRVAEFTRSGLFVWFTSNTRLNMHGSIMVYLVINEQNSRDTILNSVL